MTSNLRPCACALAAILLCFGIYLIGCSSPKTVEVVKPGKAPQDAADKDASADLYQLPAGDDVDALFGFIEQVEGFQPQSEEQYLTHRARSGPAIAAAAEKILKLEKDPKSAVAQKAADILLQVRIDDINKAAPQEQRETLKQFEAMLEGRQPTMADLRTAKNLGGNLERGANSDDLAAEAYSDFARIFAASPKFEDAAEQFTAAARRMSLVGKPLELDKLTTLDGHPFDWDQYRGKVVLVDFWATWCRPCLAELPNVKKNYEKYHALGFDVVGISTDEDRPALDDFLAKEQLPWVTLNEKKDDEGRAPVADYYGIISIPAVFLVDRDGKVISLRARGKELDEQLLRLLGPAKTDANPSDNK